MSRDAMLACLKTSFVPALRERGFNGSLPHFRRMGPDRVDLLTVQFNMWGGSFVVEIARCGVDGVTLHWGKHVPASKVTAHDVHPDKRRRLGAAAHGQDGQWLQIDRGVPLESVAQAAVNLLDEADAWWAAG